MQRRDFVAASGVAAVSALAGCDEMDSGSAPTGDQYSVTMEPVGEVTFDSVPETWATYTPGYAEMGLALGQADGLQSIGNKPRFHTDWYTQFGVDIDKSSLQQLYDGGVGKEQFINMGSDVHLIDPNWLINNFKGWEQSDIDNIVQTSGPFVGNVIFRQTDGWHDYPYYSLYEAFEKVAAVFQQQERYEAFASLHEEYVEGRVGDNLPPQSERPEVMLVFGAGNEPAEFSPYRLNEGGTGTKHLDDLGVQDALEGSDVEGLSSSNREKIDFETMLDVDPDVVLMKGHESQSAAEFRDTVVSYMESDDVASELTAVQNGRVYRGGPVYQGPLSNFLLVERTAKDLYPETFSGELFDRDRVTDIIAGNN
ncbi:ABC transporter substrate-binding protein [Haloarcula sp. S1CR25-12]|uniref:ABC transporter substrate-binding protein n=1 Tax=Haloarcula saliterrae TaxID=2950534 RepID=A0ABU2F8P0_9EURY|nr:ABC transporter substrate-binding protein [Haloarcula sp. S1CR25-12]MDS0258645.1 ABC transporter substrate-binding protein [Haloarcula sp. S1CR25-12]